MILPALPHIFKKDDAVHSANGTQVFTMEFGWFERNNGIGVAMILLHLRLLRSFVSFASCESVVRAIHAALPAF